MRRLLQFQPTGETISDAARTSLVSAGSSSGYERSEMPRREQRNAFAIENSDTDGEASRMTSTKINGLIYAPQLRWEQGASASLFYWSNKNSNASLKKRQNFSSFHAKFSPFPQLFRRIICGVGK
ncbi:MULTISPECIES: hypothetical protein [Mesorhizobium]|uniref:hypothetical protein n=1 Tax=Mesorhizobium TaxID=68287 RepID=UPI0012E122F5|nr:MULTISPECIES: hypothetical protein [Mesorhizobium]MUT27314.1 hypothetical protein [Mesorhizobium japonicum]